MFLKWGAPTSPGARQKRWVHFDTFFKTPHPSLETKITRKVGRSNLGRRTVFTKGRQTSSYLFAKSKTTVKEAFILGLVLNVRPQGYSKACAALVKTAIGSWYYFTPTQHNPILSYTGVNNPQKLIYGVGSASWYWQLGSATPHMKICSVQPARSAAPVYALSPGVSCILVAPLLWAGWSFVILPSTQAKLLDSSGWALQGSPSPVFKRLVACAKSSKHQMRGITSTVRGVAKNPNDHPHGGRTKAVKYPRTPWGKTTKKSRAPALYTKLRPLGKRKQKLRSNFNVVEEVVTPVEDTDLVGDAE